MSYTAYSDLNSLPEISFIAGTDITLTFNAKTESGVDLNITGSNISWVLCPYGQPDVNVLEKTGSVTTTSSFEVLLTASDTEDLYGKYTQQPIITDVDGYVYRPAQGDIIIEAAIVAA